jgi:hypothetical protein
MNDKDKQEKIVALGAALARAEAVVESINAELDSLVESDPEKLFDIWAINPQKAIGIAERLGLDWFLDTHTI